MVQEWVKQKGSFIGDFLDVFFEGRDEEAVLVGSAHGNPVVKVRQDSVMSTLLAWFGGLLSQYVLTVLILACFQLDIRVEAGVIAA